MKKSKEVISANTMEKVKLTENLLLDFSADVEPKASDLERARELGIDVDGLRGVMGHDEAGTY
jgi:hypothetical protein